TKLPVSITLDSLRCAVGPHNHGAGREDDFANYLPSDLLDLIPINLRRAHNSPQSRREHGRGIITTRLGFRLAYGQLRAIFGCVRLALVEGARVAVVPVRPYCCIVSGICDMLAANVGRS